MKMLMMSLLCINNVVTDLCCTLPAKILGTVTNAEHVANETVTATKKTHSSHHQKDSNICTKGEGRAEVLEASKLKVSGVAVD